MEITSQLLLDTHTVAWMAINPGSHSVGFDRRHDERKSLLGQSRDRSGDPTESSKESNSLSVLFTTPEAHDEGVLVERTPDQLPRHKEA